MFFLPYATERPRRHVPFVTYVLVLANAAVYLLFELPYWGQGGEGVGPFGFVPGRPESSALLISMFSHAGFMHLASNMLFLWLFGSVVEDVLGPLLFLGFYFGGQMGATLLDVSMARAFEPGSLGIPRVGASGAIAGILGLSAVCFSRVRVRVLYFFGYFLIWRAGVARVPAWLFLGAWLMLQLVSGFVATSVAASTGQSVGGVAYWAHIGGFGAGMVGALVLALPGKIRRHDLLGGVIYDTGDLHQRHEDLHEVVRRSPEDAAAWLALARSNEAYGFFSDAVTAYVRAAELFLARREPERAARAYQEVLHYDPGFTFPAAAQFDIALGFAHAGEYLQSRAALDRLLQAYPTSPEAEIALVRAAEMAERMGERAAAVDYLRELLRRYPYSAWRDYAREKMRALGD